MFLNGRQCIDQSTQSYAYKAFIEDYLSYSHEKKKYDLKGTSYWYDDDINGHASKTIVADAGKVLKARRDLLEIENKNYGFFVQI